MSKINYAIIVAAGTGKRQSPGDGSAVDFRRSPRYLKP